jgi:predicted amidophosphoribosyltransferase
MAPNADTVPSVCPDCGGRVITACPSCGAGIRSLMALTCADCGHELRPARLFGTEIRRKPERHRRLDALRPAHDNERTAL